MEGRVHRDLSHEWVKGERHYDFVINKRHGPRRRKWGGEKNPCQEKKKKKSGQVDKIGATVRGPQRKENFSVGICLDRRGGRTMKGRGKQGKKFP